MKSKLLISLLGIFTAFSLGGCMAPTSSSSRQTTTSSASTTTSSSTVGITTYDGEYKETTYGKEFVTKVSVSVENGIIKKVTIKEGSNLYSDKESWPDYTKWTSKEQDVLKSYEGKTVESIRNSSTIVVDNVAGATLTSNRLYQAIKDALK